MNHTTKGPGGIPERPEKMISSPKTAKLEGLEAETVAPSKALPPAASEIPSPHYPHEEISTLKPALPALPKAADLIKETITGNDLRHAIAQFMARALDEYVEDIYPKQVDKAIAHALASAEKSSAEPLGEEKKAGLPKELKEKFTRKLVTR